MTLDPRRKPLTVLSDEAKEELAAASARVAEAESALAEATRARHALWVSYVRRGASQSEVARASGVIRQAVGWALTRR